MILARSPYIQFYNDGSLEDLELELYFYQGTQGTTASQNDRPTNPQITIAADVDANGEVAIDISPYIRDYFDTFVQKDYAARSVDIIWVAQRVRKDVGSGLGAWSAYGDSVIACNGYNYPIEGVNFDGSDAFDTHFLTDAPYLYLPTDVGWEWSCVIQPQRGTGGTHRAWYQYNLDAAWGTYIPIGTGESVLRKITLSTEYILNASPVSLAGYTADWARTKFPCRLSVETTTGTAAYSLPIRFFQPPRGETSATDTARMIPNWERIVFLNRYGVPESLYFYGKRTDTYSVTDSKYRHNTLESGTYKLYNHSNSVLNKQGTQTITLNSGWYPEEFNEIFKQLFLSEKVWLVQGYKGWFSNSNGAAYTPQPLNVVSRSFKTKTQHNERVINYEVSFEFSHNTINDIS